ncbi:hypothetical protein [Paraburkholderia sp. RL17-373-BIF-A]|uniref:hypothetical protein n=1 Tax=Paraburkholderia sp. RL17-373-BIF-A TaxID=3031629 RepID=UPI0038BDAE0E
MSTIVNKRNLGQSVQTLIKKSDPDIGDLINVCEALGAVMTDIVGAECRVAFRCSADALEKAMAGREA